MLEHGGDGRLNQRHHNYLSVRLSARCRARENPKNQHQSRPHRAKANPLRVASARVLAGPDHRTRQHPSDPHAPRSSLARRWPGSPISFRSNHTTGETAPIPTTATGSADAIREAMSNRSTNASRWAAVVPETLLKVVLIRYRSHYRPEPIPHCRTMCPARCPPSRRPRRCHSSEFACGTSCLAR